MSDMGEMMHITVSFWGEGWDEDGYPNLRLYPVQTREVQALLDESPNFEAEVIAIAKQFMHGYIAVPYVIYDLGMEIDT